MRRSEFLRTLATVALLLPGLVFAAPAAGACGLCDRGLPCPSMTTPEPAATPHSCCSEAAVTAPDSPAPSSLGSMACDCGREAPPAVIAAVEAPTTDANYFEASYDAAASECGERPDRHRGVCSAFDHTTVSTHLPDRLCVPDLGRFASRIADGGEVCLLPVLKGVRNESCSCFFKSLGTGDRGRRRIVRRLRRC